MVKRLILGLLGPVAFILFMILPLEGLSPAGRAVLASTAWVAIWWIGEVTDLAVTSLLPLLLLPLSGGIDIKTTGASYGHPYIFLFMGGFIMGLAIERWNLHKRIAFSIISLIGVGERRTIVGFMVATAFISMWISNTATTIMIFPIAMSVIDSMGTNNRRFSRNLMLGIGYAASIGGMATLIGTPPNIIFAGVAKESLGLDISFFKWMVFALPFSIVLLTVAAFYLTRFKVSPHKMSKEDFSLEELGKMTRQEKLVMIIFGIVAFFWITRSFLWAELIPGLDDTIIAMAGALLMFLVPAGKGKGGLMNWDTAKKMPWNVLLIFGAGLAIAAGFSNTDLSSWLANQLLSLNNISSAMILLIVVAGVIFLTEVTSNTATASILLPLIAAFGTSFGISPLVLMIGAALAASSAYMLPVSTPPNAIVFASGKITITEMVKTGFWLSIMSIVIVFLFVYYWWPVVDGLFH